MAENVEQNRSNEDRGGLDKPFDYSYVNTVARIALYDDLRSAPRVTKINPARTNEFIENLASTIYDQAKRAGGNIPYTAIREVSENFIHAKFTEITVSILDDGDTIRFADQGPGICNKEKAQLPGFTSAVEPMKEYIRGGGSGLPIVREYLEFSHGTLTIEDNLSAGAVVTLSVAEQPAKIPPKPAEAPVQAGSASYAPPPIPPLDERERLFLKVFLDEGTLGVTDVVKLTDMPNSTVYNTLSKMEQAGLLEKAAGKKRALTELGFQAAANMQ